MLAVRRALLLGSWVFVVSTAADAVRAEDWLPIVPAELSLKSAPKAPNAPAIYLYREVNRDDNGPSEVIYERIKILTEEGRKYANIEIPYIKTTDSIRSIHARTIRPDGSIINFDGEIFDKILVKTGGVRYAAKTLTLPNVEVGGIIEYRYTHELAPYFVFNSQWILSQDLFTQYAKFSLVRSRDFVLRFAWPVGLPEGSTHPQESGGRIRMEARDVPAFIAEEFDPPENELKFRVDFIYDSSELAHETDPIAYWRSFGKRNYKLVDKFIDRPRAMKEAVAQTVAAEDTAETKLKKIYERTQRIRNLSFEAKKSEQEVKREALKDNGDVEDVWKRGYGDGGDITWLFLAMARAAGFEAYPVYVSTRNKHFFNSNMMNHRDLNDTAVEVIVDGKERFFDPGTKYTPFGLLSWPQTAVKSLRVDKDGGQWVTTLVPTSQDSRVVRRTELKLSASGSLDGSLDVTYTGQEAMQRRLDEQAEDEAARKQHLEQEVRAWIGRGAEVQLTQAPEWDNSSATLEARFDVHVPDGASITGSRMLMPASLFGTQEKALFVHSPRQHPVYFRYPTEEDDDVSIELPKGWQVGNLPHAGNVTQPAYAYATTYEESDGVLRFKRALRLDMMMVAVKAYPLLQDFFQKVRTADQDQAVLKKTASTAR
jgi:transglutaminase-like putative cysteine protease